MFRFTAFLTPFAVVLAACADGAGVDAESGNPDSSRSSHDGAHANSDGARSNPDAAPPHQVDAGANFPTVPKDVAYYDLAWAKALTLDTARVEEIQRDVRDGVTRITYKWSAFEQTFATGPGTTRSLPWTQVGVLCLPAAPHVEPARVRHAVMFNAHDGLGGAPILQEGWCQKIAAAFGIPVFLHGWQRNVVEPIAGETFHGTQHHILTWFFATEPRQPADLVLDGSFLVNANVLAKADMVAVTVLQRTVAAEWNATIDEVGALGISKEGQAHWILGAVDDRVAVLAPGGAFLGSADALMKTWEKNWNCTLPDGTMPPLFRQAVRLMDWYRSTPAGRMLERVVNPIYFGAEIHARHLLISADLGTPGQHDWIWPLQGEAAFFAAFQHPSYRFVRAFDGSGILLDDGVGEHGASLLVHVADLLLNDTTTPTQPIVTHQIAGDTVTVTARGRFDGSLAKKEMILVFVTSPERTLRVKDAKWEVVPMVVQGDGAFVASVSLPDAGKGLTYYVMAREAATRANLAYWRSASTLPVEINPVAGSDCRFPAWDDPAWD